MLLDGGLGLTCGEYTECCKTWGRFYSTSCPKISWRDLRAQSGIQTLERTQNNIRQIAFASGTQVQTLSLGAGMPRRSNCNIKKAVLSGCNNKQRTCPRFAASPICQTQATSSIKHETVRVVPCNWPQANSAYIFQVLETSQ
jgi:hypothetical protein